MATNDDTRTVIGLDIGTRRIGLAAASVVTKLPRPVGAIDIEQTPEAIDMLKSLFRAQKACAIVIGLPRNLHGDDTAQTRLVRDFGKQLKSKIKLPVYWIDEALTSKHAETELRERGIINPPKGDIDALAACYILTDFLATHQEEF